MRSPRLYLTVLVIGTLVSVTAAWAGTPPPPADVNVLQDCWTTNLEADPDPERELYTFAADDDIAFIWKQKLLVACSSYVARIVGYDCVDGEPGVNREVKFSFTEVFGPMSPIPGIPEPLFPIFAPAGSIPPGRYDWVLLVECDDTNGRVKRDGDLDDECGINVGRKPVVPDGPLIFGPEPIEIFDPDPGGSPPGRGPGEEGTTRPWCFEVAEPPPPFDLCPPDECATFVPCNVTGDCFCFDLFDDPGTGGCIADAPCGVDCSAGGDADCAGGEVCVFNTCCGFPNCVPAACGNPLTPPGIGPTNASDIFSGKR